MALLKMNRSLLSIHITYRKLQSSSLKIFLSYESTLFLEKSGWMFMLQISDDIYFSGCLAVPTIVFGTETVAMEME